VYFIPTPGGSGTSEFGFMAIFASSMPSYLLGVYTILWRFFTNHINLITGGILLFRMFGFGTIKSLTSVDIRKDYEQGID